MKEKPPKKIWVNNRADNTSSFAEYINGRRRNFMEGRLGDYTANRLQSFINDWKHRNPQRKLVFVGDKLPEDFLTMITL